ncbi:hypothetical protein [Pseudaminobacter salicylatoxidans]|uniref:hypothetical protein n=1 Tax=Pseudaminobacter salicylatoxidans TaxID=93369 RepID=UPI0002D9F1B8|nr:hypothetical protein [Pseudaminobacter salicylatoxidans]
MKNLVLASIIAITSAIPFGLPAQAGEATFSNAQYVYREWGPRYYGPRHYAPRYYRPYGWARHCRVEVVRHHRNGHVWYDKVRVCR